MPFAALPLTLKDFVAKTSSSNRAHMYNSTRASDHYRARCTHLTIDRSYGAERCHICGRPSPLGYVYTCVQDELLTRDSTIYGGVKGPACEQVLMQEIGMSEWIIKATEDGRYSTEQVEILKKQKSVLNATIAATYEAERYWRQHRLSYFTGNGASLGEPPAVFNSQEFFETLSHNDYVKAPSFRKEVLQPCNFRCCPACRPHMTERVYLSLNALPELQLKPLTPWDYRTLPVKDIAIARTIGARISLHQTHTEKNEHSPTDSTDLMNSSYISSLYSSASFSTCDETDEEFNYLPKTQPDAEIDLSEEEDEGLLRKSLRRTASAISGDDRTHMFHKFGSALSLPEVNMRRASLQDTNQNDDLSRPLDDEGGVRLEKAQSVDLVTEALRLGTVSTQETFVGVAITEDAVEHGTSDIITQV